MMEAEYAGIAVEATTAGAAQAAPLTRFLRENPRVMACVLECERE